MKKNDLYKVINKLEPTLFDGKKVGGILGCLLVFLICQKGQAQQKTDDVVINKGILKIDGNTQVSSFFDFSNENTGSVKNDGELYIYKNYNNDGVVGFTTDTIVKNKLLSRSKGTTFFNGNSRVLTSKQLIEGKAVSKFQNVEFNNENDLIPFDLKTTIMVGNNSDFKLGIVNALENGKMIFDENAVYSNAGEDSFVDGMVQKLGQTEFEYPVGNNLYFRPSLGASDAKGNNSYTSQYFYQETDNLYPHSSKDDKSIRTINNAEYWQITQTGGADRIVLGLTLDAKTTPSEFFTLPANTKLAIVRWDPVAAKWMNDGGTAEGVSSTAKAYSNFIMGEVNGYGIFTIAIVDDIIIDNPDIIVFNAISPNGDGINDTFHLQGIDNYPDNTVEIYNRWGVKVFETKSYNESDNVFSGYSDGRSTVKRGEKLPTGTYFYILKYNKDGKGMDKSGYLYINNQ
jgi:gliding motility-associated-like protein